MKRILYFLKFGFLGAIILVAFTACSDKEKVVDLTSEQIQTTSELSAADTVKTLDEIVNNCIDIMEGHNDAITLWNNMEFTSIDDVTTYENVWQELYEKTQGVATVLNKHLPSPEYEELWNKCTSSVEGMMELYSKCTNLDANQDGTYTGAEMLQLIKSTGESLLQHYEKIADVEKTLQSASITNSYHKTDANDNNSDTSKVSNTPCDVNGCDNAGIYEFSIFSDEIKGNYCEAHYNEMIDMIGEMEKDVASGPYSKHTCEECSREGIYNFIGLSGTMEYYCTEHYYELVDLLESLGLL